MSIEKELEQINNLIEDEKRKHLDRLITDLVSIEQDQKEQHPPKKSPDDKMKVHDDEHTAMIALVLVYK